MASKPSGLQCTGLGRQSGLSEILWACVLDDYLSEEEENEFSKIVGSGEATSWLPHHLCGHGHVHNPRQWKEDPREARIRGGSGLRKPRLSDELMRQHGRKGDESSSAGAPPLAWLSVPSIDDESTTVRKRAPSRGNRKSNADRRSGHLSQIPRHSEKSSLRRESSWQTSSSRLKTTDSKKGGHVEIQTNTRQKLPPRSRSRPRPGMSTRGQQNNRNSEERDPISIVREGTTIRLQPDEISRQSSSSNRRRLPRSLSTESAKLLMDHINGLPMTRQSSHRTKRSDQRSRNSKSSR